MVYKVFQSARTQGQSVIKALGHNGGSLFHVGQSGYAAANNPFAPLTQSRRPQTGNRQNSDLLRSFTTQVGSNSIAERVAAGSPTADSHLYEYLAAWQKQQVGGEKEWKQFQFPKRIGYNGATEEAKTPSAENEGNLPEPGQTQVPDAQAKAPEATSSEAIAVEQLNKEIAEQITQLHSQELERVAAEAHPQSLPVEIPEAINLTQDAQDVESVTIRSITPTQSSATDATTISPVQTQEADLFTDRLSYLRDIGNYGEIPAVFETMLRQGLVPSANAYNALIAAAYHLPSQRHHVVPKVLDVYSDMLRRAVAPNKATYTLMLEIMAVRAMEVFGMKRELAENRLRYAAFQDADKYLFRAQELSEEVSVDADVLTLTSKIFAMAASDPAKLLLASETYRVLLQAYSESGDVDQMIRVYSHMENGKVVPIASTFAPMIRAFAKSGDLRSAVECYNEYRNLAIQDNSGKFSLISRADNDVYAAVVESYLTCDKEEGAQKFLSKVMGSFEPSGQELQVAKNTIASEAVIKSYINSKRYAEALKIVEDHGMTGGARDAALVQICNAAADRGHAKIAVEAYQIMSSGAQIDASPAMMVMHIRNNDIADAQSIWNVAARQSISSAALIAPAALLASSVAQQSSAMEAFAQLRFFLDQVRIASRIPGIQDTIDGALAFIGADLARKGVVLAGPAAVSLVRAMLENQGLIPSTTEHLLARLGPDAISSLNAADLTLMLQIQADIIRGQQPLDAAHASRFAAMVDVAMSQSLPLAPPVVESVEAAMPRLVTDNADLVARWQARTAPTPSGMPSQAYGTRAASQAAEGVDPYASNTDHRGSALIIDELDKHTGRNGSPLNEVLARFKNIRRAGRHPRYIAYAKLIGAAARDGRTALMHDILGMAQQDMPLQSQYPVVRHGWITILDAMVAACLTTGNRSEALRYHQQLLDIGAAPTANTFGLYITTLKESTKTFDEATEAVRIFQRAKTEGVEPSSFLYNALIGKLGKARRIDDCLFYFSEMRQLGIRPTSVTYGTIVNALCRVSDERFAIELFDEMESMPNYKPRPAPYNSMMQFFLTTKRDSSKVLEYYSRMQSRGIQPTMHTYKLLIDTYATLDPINLPAAEGVLELIRASGQKPEPVHFAALIHARGCVLHDMAGARQTFDNVIKDPSVRAHSCLYQALFESMVANHTPMAETTPLLTDMRARRVELTPYIANTLIHGWASEGNLTEARKIYAEVGMEKREPSTYEAMTKAYLSVDGRDSAQEVVREMLSRGYPAAVSGKVLDLLGHVSTKSAASPVSVVPEATLASVAA